VGTGPTPTTSARPSTRGNPAVDVPGALLLLIPFCLVLC
jgi:hypothetical protein